MKKRRSQNRPGITKKDWHRRREKNDRESTKRRYRTLEQISEKKRSKGYKWKKGKNGTLFASQNAQTNPQTQDREGKRTKKIEQKSKLQKKEVSLRRKNAKVFVICLP